MIKLILISDLTGGPGGVYTYLKQLESNLNSIFDVTILLEHNTKNQIQNIYKFKKAVFIPLSQKYNNEDSINTSLQTTINNIKPNVIHIINGSIKSNLIIREFLLEERIPFIVTEQYIDREHLIPEILRKRLFDIHSQTYMTIFVSNENRSIATTKYNINPTNSMVITNSVNVSVFKKEQFNSTPYSFFTVGRCVEQKGIDIIIKSLSIIKDKKIEFHVIGGGENEYKYLEMAKSLLNYNIDFRILPWQKNINYADFIKKYDLYISASRDEGLSYSLLEVTTYGMPIICSRCSGNVELIEENNRGSLFPINDYQSLAREIVKFIDSPTQLINLAKFNTMITDSKYNLDNQIKKLVDIYKKLLTR